MDIFELTKANSHHIITFWDDFYKKLVTEDVIQKFQPHKELRDRFTVLEADVKKPLYQYRTEILKKQIQKDEILQTGLALIEANLEEMVEKSKGEIQSFKKRLRAFIKSNPDVLNEDTIEANIKLRELKDKLYEIEQFNKVETAKKIDDLNNKVDTINKKMDDDLKTMKDGLDSLKTIREDLASIIKKKQQSYTDEDKHNDDALDDDITNETEKVGDIFSDQIDTLYENISKERDKEKQNYFEDLKNKEYYRNRQRIEDINEAYKFWNNKVVGELKKLKEERRGR